MRTLIIPCAGSRMVDGLPLFLNCHPDGTLLAKKAVDGIGIDNYDRIVYSILKEIDDKFSAGNIIKNTFKNNSKVEICILPQKTNGPAETVYNTIKNANIEGEFSVRDSHAYIEIDKFISGNFIAGLDLTIFEKTIENLRSKSFIVLNEQHQVLDVVEKHFCSDVISAGLYGFKSSEDYKVAFEHLSDSNYPITKLYISHIISYLIGYSKRVFHSIQVKKFEDWSTKSAWQKVQKTYSTNFIDLDCIFEKTNLQDDKYINYMAELSKNGASFVGFTCKLDKIELQKFFASKNINVLDIISINSVSKVKNLILDRSELEKLYLEV